MLVLTRKLNEQILIGDDIKITLIRVRGNSVRIGIEAPRDVRVVRGELDKLVAPKQATEEIDDLAQVFAHPQSNRAQQAPSERPDNIQPAGKSKVFVGSVRRSGSEAKLARAPLASFVSAS